MQSLGEHEMPTVQQKCIMNGNAKREPFSRNAPFSVSQNVNRSAEMQSPRAVTAHTKASMPYHSDMVTGQGGLAKVYATTIVGGPMMEANTCFG